MRATPLLAAVAAGLISLSAVAEEAPKSSAPVAGEPVAAAPAPTLVVSVKSDEKPVVAAPAATSTKAEAPSAPVAHKPAAPSLVARINLSTQRMQLTYEGRSQESWAISSGREGYPTPRGVFRPQWTSKMWYSKKYDNAPMPNAVFFSGGVAVHGTQSIGALGSPASHGCVRLAPSNAARFYSLVHKHGLGNTRIEVIGSPPASRVARHEPRTRERVGGYTSPRAPSWSYGSWTAPSQQVAVRRGPNGVVHLPPNSPYRGQNSFVLNGVTYVRVR